MYTYRANDPVNYVDPSRLFIGKFFRDFTVRLNRVSNATSSARATVSTGLPEERQKDRICVTRTGNIEILRFTRSGH